MANEPTHNLMDKIVALCKRRGFIYPGSEIYGGFSGTFDYGPLGVALKKNIENLWWRFFVESRQDMYGVDSAILMNPKVWEASGHVGGFSDPMAECEKCKKRFRADQLPEKSDPRSDMEDGIQVRPEKSSPFCPECGGKLGEMRQFTMLFKTYVGATEDDASLAYLRPETAQGMFVNFKNIVDSFHPKLPFGIAQIGKAFRNEIAPRDFIFRAREFEQMEVEYFVKPQEWKEAFALWQKKMHEWIAAVGIDAAKVYELEVPDKERAHYSKRTIDFEFEFPFGRKELYGLAYRTDYDLKKHAEASGVDLSYLDEETKEKIVPHVVEPSLGVDRTILAVLLSAYAEDEMNGAKPNQDDSVARTVGDGSREKRVVLKLKPSVAPVKVAVFPLLKNKPDLVKKAMEVHQLLCSMFHNSCSMVAFDDNGNIGKRYRRQDEIGTITAVTVDFETLDNDTVTLRDRDSAKQIRVHVSRLSDTIGEIIAGKLFSEFPREVK